MIFMKYSTVKKGTQNTLYLCIMSMCKFCSYVQMYTVAIQTNYFFFIKIKEETLKVINYLLMFRFFM